MCLRDIIIAIFLVAGLLPVSRDARAAGSYDNCTGFIDSVPAVIETQGTWCLRKDLSTAQTNDYAIDIRTNNVTIDCNDFKLGGLAAGHHSSALGIHAGHRQNVTIRNCNIRGFLYGIYLSGEGHLVEDNRLDGNLVYGIAMEGVHNQIRHNRVYATGGWTGGVVTFGIDAAADIVDNIVDGVFTAGTTSYVMGIRARGSGTRISGNRIGGLALNGGGIAYGIQAGQAAGQAIEGNRIVAEAPGTGGLGIDGDSSDFCGGNTVANFEAVLATDPCNDIGGNDRL